MKIELRYPNIDKNAPPAVQVAQMRAYLFALIDQLQIVINNLPEADESKKGENK